MPFPDFHNDTFVAFCDISGFKQKMSQNPEGALQALKRFYSDAYGILQETRERGRLPVYALLVSDCAILVADNTPVDGETSADRDIAALEALLSTIKRLNKNSLQYDIMLTTSIAYGPFHYEQRSELLGIEKNLLMGSAYIEAYIDQSAGKPKLQCGDCRIIEKNVPPQVLVALDNKGVTLFQMIQKQKKYYYYYWMRQRPEEIAEFQAAYKNTENLKYVGIRLLLQGHQDLNVIPNDNP
jgi:hypothetical protein